MEHLEKRRHAQYVNNDKYYIDCNHFANNATSIQTQKLFKNNENVSVLQAIATDETIKKKNRHIVVKIGRIMAGKKYMAEKEYEIGRYLQQCPGFIKFLCIFQCYDDTNKQHDYIEEGGAPLPISTSICTANNVKNNYKFVLVMPYIQNGSLLRYNWTNDNVDLLKNLIIHTMLSLAYAFEQVGFIHGDLHWDNILFKRTTMDSITYNLQHDSITVPTYGYKVVIMDFEKSDTGYDDISYFWENISFLLMKYGVENKNNDTMKWNIASILLLLEGMVTRHEKMKTISQLISKMQKTVITLNTIP